jgi:hypothetical protein
MAITVQILSNLHENFCDCFDFAVTEFCGSSLGGAGDKRWPPVADTATAQEFMLMFMQKEKKGILRLTGFGSWSRANNPGGGTSENGGPRAQE